MQLNMRAVGHTATIRLFDVLHGAVGAVQRMGLLAAYVRWQREVSSMYCRSIFQTCIQRLSSSRTQFLVAHI